MVGRLILGVVLTCAAASGAAGQIRRVVTPDQERLAAAAAERLVATLDLAEDVGAPLRRVMAYELATAFHPGCTPEPLVARLVDLNGDAKPEVYVKSTRACGWSTPTFRNWMFAQQPGNSTWHTGYLANGPVTPLLTTNGGFRYLAVDQPPFDVIVHGWTDQGYQQRCIIAREPPLRSGVPCPPDLGTPSGADLPAFGTAAERNARLRTLARGPAWAGPTPEPTPAEIRTAARAAAALVTAPLSLGPAERDGLAAAVTLDFTRRRVRRFGGPGRYETSGCENVEVTARLVDLNDDNHPEVEVRMDAPCIGGMGSGNTSLFVMEAGTRRWRSALENVWSSFVPLRSRARANFVDIESAGPGMTQGVWRFDGARYQHFCTAADQPGGPGHDCPFTIAPYEPGADFAPFPGNRAPNICGVRGTYAIFAVRPLSALSGLNARVLSGDDANKQVLHEQLFFCNDGRVTRNVGFTNTHVPGVWATAKGMWDGPGTTFSDDPSLYPQYRLERSGRYPDVARMAQAVDYPMCPDGVTGPLARRCADADNRCWTTVYEITGHNCQVWADEVRARYAALRP